MVRIPRCDYLTSYKSRENDTYFDQVEIAGLVFFVGKLQKGLNSCRNGGVSNCSCETVATVARIDLYNIIYATYTIALQSKVNI